MDEEAAIEIESNLIQYVRAGEDLFHERRGLSKTVGQFAAGKRKSPAGDVLGPHL
jgi:hypothetical protein